MTLERRSRGKIACYASREPTELDAIINQRRDRGLETRYGAKMFDRVGRRIVLTQTGRDFLNEAREVIARAKGRSTALG
jgi:hypothetical protein